jgi:hypothetical protein
MTPPTPKVQESDQQILEGRSDRHLVHGDASSGLQQEKHPWVEIVNVGLAQQQRLLLVLPNL